MIVEFLAIAEDEYREAVDYYEAERPGLGGDFVDDLTHTLQRIVSFPHAGVRLSRRTRRCLIRRFPYAIIYQRRPGMILIVAVMHLKRHPDSWRDRT